MSFAASLTSARGVAVFVRLLEPRFGRGHGFVERLLPRLESGGHSRSAAGEPDPFARLRLAPSLLSLLGLIERLLGGDHLVVGRVEGAGSVGPRAVAFDLRRFGGGGNHVDVAARFA